MSAPVYLTDGWYGAICAATGKLAFSRFNESAVGADGTGTFQLFVADRDGSNEVCISAAIPTLHVGAVTWHPSGAWLLVTREMSSHYGVHAIAHPGNGLYVNIWAVTPDGATWVQLTDYANTPVGAPYFAEPIGALIPKVNQDGTKLAWARKIGYELGSPDGLAYWDIAVADLVTVGTPSLANEAHYTPGSARFYELWDWTRDGQKLIVVSDYETVDAYLDPHLWLVGSNELQKLTWPNLQWEEQAFFSPNDRRVVMMTTYGQTTVYNPVEFWTTFFTDLFLLDAKVGAQRLERLTFFNLVGHAQYFPRDAGIVVRAIPSQWLDDGTLLIMLMLNDGPVQLHAQSELWVMETDGAASVFTRQAVTTTGAPGSAAAAAQTVTMTAATPATGNRFLVSGNDLILAYNAGATGRRFYVEGATNAWGRSVVIDEALAAGQMKIFGPLRPEGWMQTDGAIWISGTHAEVTFGIVRL